MSIDEINRILYPTRTAVVKKKKKMDLGEDTMKFSLETFDHQVHQFLASGSTQLMTWLLGLQWLSAKPGQVGC